MRKQNHAVGRKFGSASMALALVAVSILVLSGQHVAFGQTRPGVDYRVLATNKTSTMEKELNEAAEAGFRFQAAMGGETTIGGSEVVAVVTRTGVEKARYAYK